VGLTEKPHDLAAMGLIIPESIGKATLIAGSPPQKHED
jgi:hypothetical protein